MIFEHTLIEMQIERTYSINITKSELLFITRQMFLDT